MCCEIKIDGKWYDTIGGMESALGVKAIKDPTYKYQPTDDSCLCAADVEATVAQVGRTVTRDELFDWIVQ